MQSSGRVSRTKSQRPRWDDDMGWDDKKRHHKSSRPHHEVRRNLEDYFERKRIKELTEDVWN
jgi:hypothetical protein